MALRVWLPLNGTLDNIGVSGVTVTNNGATVDNNGKIGKCYNFNGSSYMTVPFDATKLQEHFSIAVWVKFPDATSGNKQIIAFSSNSGWGNVRCTMLYRTASAQALFSISDGTNYVGYNFNITITPNVWQHLCVTFKDKVLTWYLNGEFQKTYTTTYNPKLSDLSGFGIGGAYNGAEKFTGYLNDVRIYDHCLSPKEVKEISQGLVLHYKLDGFSGGNGNNILLNTNHGVSNWNFNIGNKYNQPTKEEVNWLGVRAMQATTKALNEEFTSSWCLVYYNDGQLYNNLKPSTKYTISFDSNIHHTSFTVLQGNGTNNMGTGYTYHQEERIDENGQTYWHIVGTFTTLAEFTGTGQYVYISSNMTYMNSAGNIAKYANIKCEEGEKDTHWSPAPQDLGIDTTKITDSSGYGNDGTIIGTIITEQNTERYGISIKNTTQYLSKTELNFPETKGLTFAFWTKINTWGHQTSGLFCTSDIDGNPTDYQTTAMNHRDSGVDLKVSGGSSYRLISAPSAGIWHHCAFTHDGTNAKYYEDGVLKATNNSVSGNLVSFKYLYIGWSYAGGVNRQTLANWNDFRMYCTALSAEDILDLYHTPTSIDNSKKLHTFELEETSENILSSSAFEQGGITDANGAETEMTTRLRTFYIPVTPNTSYKIFTNTNFQVRGVHFFTENQTWISFTSFFAQTGQFTTPSNCYYIRIPFQKADNAANITLADLGSMGPTLTAMIARTNGLSNKTYNINIFKNGITRANHFSISQKSSVDKSGIIEATDFIEK